MQSLGYWSNKRITIWCDNQAVVEVLTTGKCRDNIRSVCARNIWLISAIYNFQIKVQHISGQRNATADLLSIWTNSHSGPAQLVTFASDRLLDGFRPATKRQYARMWLHFQSFKVAAGLSNYQVNVFILLSFMEYLFQNSHSHRNIANYMAAIRAHHILYGLNTAPFRDKRMSLHLKSLKLQASLAPSRRSSVDIYLLN